VNVDVDIGIRSTNIPLFVCFAAFLITFVATRVITRMIRAGKGPFRDNVSESGLHIHHAVPGIILLVVGAFMAVGTDSEAWTIVAAALVGSGTSLVLDEFALILHLQDVYWSDEGRISVEMVSLAIACLGLVLIGVRPFDFSGQGLGTVSVAAWLAVLAVSIVGCVDKGKYPTALFGAFIPIVSIVGAIRLARPTSRWARRRYTPERIEQAKARAERFDRRWGRYTRWMNEFAGMGDAPIE
jgi:hypothetical protein